MATSSFLFWIHKYGFWGVWAWMTLENMGVPIPTAAGFLYAVLEVQAGRQSFAWAFTIINLGHLVGSGISYLLGRYSNNAVARRWQRSQKMQQVRVTLENWYARYGPWTLLLGRLVGYVRPFSSFVAGLGKVGWKPFGFWTLLGTLIINSCCWLVTATTVRLWITHPQWRWFVGIILLLFTVGLFLYGLAYGATRQWQRWRRQRVPVPAVTEPILEMEANRLMDPSESPTPGDTASVLPLSQ